MGARKALSHPSAITPGAVAPEHVRTLPERRREGLSLERSVSWPARDVVALTQTFNGDGSRTIVTHNAALIAMVEVRSGTITFPLAAGTVCAPPRFILVVPPRSVLPIAFLDAHVTSVGLGTIAALERHTVPALLEWPKGMPLEWPAMTASPTIATLDADATVPPAVVAVRSSLHDDLSATAPVRLAARRRGIRADSLSRDFARAYGCPPKQYCTRARMFDAVIVLLNGARILDAAFNAGFRDLKRFYTHFRQMLQTTPGTYASVKNRQDVRGANR